MRRAVSCLLICMILACGVCLIPVNAASLGIVTESLSEEEKAAFADKLSLEQILNDENKSGIQCFDVNEDGTVAIATGSGNHCAVYVYDSQGTFQYGYRFSCDGDYGVVFCENVLSLFFLRGDTFAFFDASGRCIDAQKVTNPEQNHVYFKEILNRTVKEVAGRIYALERDLNLGDSYSRLVVSDEQGETTLIYDAGSDHIVAQIIGVVLVILFFTVVITGLIKKRSMDCKCRKEDGSLPQ